MKVKRKTRKAAQKRFKLTSTGKVVRGNTKRRHLLGHKSPGSKRQKRAASASLVAKPDVNSVKEMLPGAF